MILPYSLLLIGEPAKSQAGPSLKRLPGSLPDRGRLRDGTNGGDENDSDIFDNFHFLSVEQKMLMIMKLMFLNTFNFFFQVKHFISCPASLEEKYSMMRLADLLKRNKKVGFFPFTFDLEIIRESGATKS